MSEAQVLARLNRIEEAVQTMAWWLVAAQTGFGEKDAQGIRDILSGIKQVRNLEQAANDGEATTPAKGTGI